MPLSQIFGGVTVVSGSLSASFNEAWGSPSTIPAGYDAILEFSTHLLQRTLVSNLEQAGLAPLSVRVPYQADQVSPGLRGVIANHWRLPDLTRPRYLELVVSVAQIKTLGPRIIDDLTEVGTTTTTVGVAMASRLLPHRTVSIIWSIQVNLFEPKQVLTTAQPRAAVPGLEAASHPTLGTIPATVAKQPVLTGVFTTGTFTTGTGLAPGLPAGDRTTVAQGTASIQVPALVSVAANTLQFSVSLNFSGVQPTYQSDDPNLSEFLKTSYATNMLGQAVAPLLSSTAVRLSPAVALAGNLAAAQISLAQLSLARVRDLVVPDGEAEVLALCVSLRNNSGGVPSMVRSFLGGHDFAYYVSETILDPVLRALWRAHAVHGPIVGETSVQMPVDSNSDQTATGRARVQVNISDTLKQSGIRASDKPLGDPLRLESEQTVQLLALWDPKGNQINDLGDLAAPAVEPLVMNLQLFDQPPANDQQSLQPAVRDFIVALLRPVYIPMLDKLPIEKISGFTSSALRALLSSWNLKPVLRPITTVGGGVGVVKGTFGG